MDCSPGSRRPHHDQQATAAYPAWRTARPRADADSATVLAQAVDTLTALRTPYWLGDSAVGLHALASLIAQAQQVIPEAVARARDQGHT